MKDTRNAVAKARDLFFEENENLLEGEAFGQYLRNRLEMAFLNGYVAGEKAWRFRKVKHLVRPSSETPR